MQRLSCISFWKDPFLYKAKFDNIKFGISGTELAAIYAVFSTLGTPLAAPALGNITDTVLLFLIRLSRLHRIFAIISKATVEMVP